MGRAYLGLNPSSAAVLSGLSVGTWELSFADDRVRGDAVFARLFGVSADAAEQGITLARFAAAFHPDDRAHIQRRQRSAIENGGLFVLEHRTIPAPGVVRWVLARGQFERGADGRVTGGRGICLDMTDSRADGHVAGRLRASFPDTTSPLDDLAGHALNLWDALDGLDAASDERVRPALRHLLEEIGRLIADAVQTSSSPPGQAAGGLH